MIQIALESSGKRGSIAILDGENSLWGRPVGENASAASEIGTAVREALAWFGNHGRQADLISVAVGPGSFTGIRIAVTTAKTLAYALNRPVVPVGSLIAIAASTALEPQVSRVVVGLNAYRHQVFAAQFEVDELRDADSLRDCNHRVETTTRSDWDRLVHDSTGSPTVAVTGDPSIFSTESAGRTSPRQSADAVGVGRIASRVLANHAKNLADPAFSEVVSDAFSVSARYVKLSAAEEKAAAR